ncbi:MAG TPA: metal ABC transporter substrate-binding protein [Candidatus Sulfotelmatobacter sp.]|nr:metal ABC transporter substrate-binding protein [Candidatus Sulfotelmatobacter sp.]
MHLRPSPAFALGAALLACAQGAAAAPVRVVTTTTDLRALAEAVGGDRVRAVSLAPPAQDPHAVEAKPGHVEALREAQLFVRVGVGHDAWVVPAVERAGNRTILPGQPGFVNAAEEIDLLEPVPPGARGGVGHAHAGGNPHYWLDPDNAAQITANILAGLRRVAPREAPVFAANREAFLARLAPARERWIRAVAPFAGARVVAYHDSWPYFARRFGLQVAGFIEPRPGVPPSPASLAELIDRMKRHQVRVVIAEPYVDQGLAGLVASRAGARVAPLAPSVGSAEGAGDYVQLFDYDVAQLLAAFAGREARP